MRTIHRSVAACAIALGAALVTVPSASASVEPAKPVPTTSTGGVTTQNANGCSEKTCIDIDGNKLYVRNVTTSTHPVSGARCYHIDWLGHSKGVSKLHGIHHYQTCTPTPANQKTLWSNWYANKNFPNGYKVCVHWRVLKKGKGQHWTGIPGQPCETIHK
ncbi:hypothetical protein NE236_24770 [Actinoallomurus purpureus]|uniref:hypothetical protein n=1 Tax=Actinoallomurus purpureus TaxID=478114 RepID=UPI00209252FC|nr:hypothetical protein [Actinoallomurus purpureus]MCO6008197.1 hypothetical protein [Actinoallomurus purpureus]